MNIEEFRDYCLAKPAASESFPFDDNVLVFKVMGKIFALTSMQGDFSINLKCDPERALRIRMRYPAISPGFHMNKKHWNTILVDGSLDDSFIRALIDHSYDLVVARLTKSQRGAIQELINNEERLQ
ncbi:MAG: MmcQ-like protein [Bacteroidetes bacterium]|nr:MAG: MmcQ-like protein [Bacteroidota bacterium]PIE88161.1 MAG: MmcQ-like protein [Bacteroidota bacterium]